MREEAGAGWTLLEASRSHAVTTMRGGPAQPSVAREPHAPPLPRLPCPALAHALPCLSLNSTALPKLSGK